MSKPPVVAPPSTSRLDLAAGLARLRAAKGKPDRRGRARLVFAVDATASRSTAWNAARKLTDTLFEALPGELDVALAVHGGSRVHTFTDFLKEPGALRDAAARISCEAGETVLVDIMKRTADQPDVKMLIYIGDAFEESIEAASRVADTLKAKGVRMIILHDDPATNAAAADIFADLTRRTDGFVLPFDASAVGRLRDVLAAAAVLAVGGVTLLEQKKKTLPAAALLLSHVPGRA